MAYLIDTDIIIYSVKGNVTVRDAFARNESALKTMSVVTYAELSFGARNSANPEKNMATVRRIAELVPLVDISRAIAETFADVKALLNRTGHPIADMDLLIAATALTLNYILVTNNERHFARVPGLRIENWSK